jgi:hypothetical protein
MKCIPHRRSVLDKEWTHLFVHILETIPKNWYIKLLVHTGTRDWEELTRNFMVMFSFEISNHLIDLSLEVLRNNIFTSEDLLV